MHFKTLDLLGGQFRVFSVVFGRLASLKMLMFDKKDAVSDEIYSVVLRLWY